MDPHFNPPAPDPEKLKTHQFLLLRHAVTEFNMEFARIVGLHGLDSDEYRHFKVKKELIDPPLLPEGVKQCESAQSIANTLDIAVVFVSPMVRTC